MSSIKCIIWDLDNTIWDGVLLESENVTLKPNIVDIIKELDGRGILHSIASKNEHRDVMEVLKKFAIEEYFLYPEINWNPKSQSVRNIQASLNIAMDSILFIDDQQFELEEVKHEHPLIQTFDADDYVKLLTDTRLIPRFITDDSIKRRQRYKEDMHRQQEEKTFYGTNERFLATLDMKFMISEATEEDLRRAEELTIRTNQLNSTGITYDYDELKLFMNSEKYKLYVCELIDKFGSYGKIGLLLVEYTKQSWHIKLLLMSCRIMSRGIGSVLLAYIINQANQEEKTLYADFRHTGKNRMMYMTYKMSNFIQVGSVVNDTIILKQASKKTQKIPNYVDIIATGG